MAIRQGRRSWTGIASGRIDNPAGCIINCTFLHDFRLESSSVIIGVTGLSAWEAHLFNIVVVYFVTPAKIGGVTPYFVRRVGST